MPALRKKIGQMLMVGLEGAEPSAEECRVFKHAAVGGFILFKQNLSDPEQIVRLCRSLWQIGAEHPPLIGIDEEGGSVHRLPAPFTHFPAAAVIGNKNDSDLAYRLGRATAEELALVGINLNFAPVLDVNSNAQNPVIGDRSFAAVPETVIRLSDRWTQGLREGGIIPCGKHFPGHGGTDRDSHFELPIVARSFEEMSAVEFSPFAHACRNKIEALMTAHVLYPALDPDLPATLSHAIITGLLRQRFGYDGPVFSDDMEMKAISDNYRAGAEPAALLAVRAGVDVLLYSHELARPVEAYELLCSEAERHPEIRARVENSYRRITELKRRRVKIFTGAPENEVRRRLAQLDHQRLVNEIHGIR
jgi:beta-N-acetylhexosaminidase